MLAAYRVLNPRSRAVAATTVYGSGARVRRVTCVYCRTVIATSDARYPETKASREARRTHAPECERRYLAALVPVPPHSPSNFPPSTGDSDGTP